MKVEFEMPQYKGYRARAVTFDGMYEHKEHGLVRMKIWRAVGNDNGVAAKLTIDLLRTTEPNVGMFPGDVIEYYTAYGTLIERVTG